MHRSRGYQIVLLLSLLLVMILVFPVLSAPASASVSPTVVQGNPTCSDLVAGTSELKVEPPGNGTFSNGVLTVTISNFTGTSFDFSANLPIDAVFVKAATEGNLYRYIPGVLADTNLTSPGSVHAISHISFCYGLPTPTPTPTNTPTDTPTYTPTNTPTNTPTDTPTYTPTNTPTNTPTDTPTITPSNTPTDTPTITPSNTPTDTPTITPSNTPTDTPTITPSNTPSNTPTDTPTNTPTNTPIPFDGCTPGYWKQEQHFDSWVGYTPNQTLESVFNVPDSFGLDNVTLVEALDFGGGSGTLGAARNLLRAAVAALLNASNPSVDYPMTEAQIIAAVNAALLGNRGAMLSLATQLDTYNNYGCPLN